MRGAERVVFAFGSLGEARKTSRGPQRANSISASCQYFMRIRLVPDVPYQPVFGCIKDVVQRDCQFYNAKTRTQVAAGDGNSLYSLGPEFFRDFLEVRRLMSPQVSRAVDALKHIAS
jgi:hypothetical protein